MQQRHEEFSESSGRKEIYRKKTDVLASVFNFSLAFILFVLSLPIFIAIAIAIKIIDGGDIFYKSIRLGKNYKPFTMYKFRTLSSNAHQFVGARHVNDGVFKQNKMISPLGQFLRETRLDELPQLVNILKGDMNLVGPRPHRPEIFDEFKKHYRFYGRLLNVKPGLIGYRQLYTPHSSPIKLQILYDYRFIDGGRYIFWNLYFVIATAYGVTRIILKKLCRFFYHDLILRLCMRRYKEKRVLERISLGDARVEIGTRTDEGVFVTDAVGSLVDMNEEAVRVKLPAAVGLQETFIQFHTLYRKKPLGRTARKSAICFAKAVASYNHQDKMGEEKDVVYFYTPITPLNEYKIHKYFLQENMLG